MEKENSFEKADDTNSEVQSGTNVSAAGLMKDALSKGKMAEEKRKIIERNEEPKARSFLPKWVTIVLAIFSAWVLSKELFKYGTLITVLLLLMFILSLMIYIIRRRILISNQNAYYYRNVMSSISILMGFLILANHDYITKRYSRVFMNNPQFYYSADADDYGRPEHELNVESESGSSVVPMTIQWGIVGVARGLPFLIWSLTNLSFEKWKATNRRDLQSMNQKDSDH